MRTFARSLAVGLIAVAASVSASVATAQEFPAKPIRIIVPFPAGGAMDLLARQVGQGFTERLNQQVIVDNRPGAGGVIGTQAAAKSPNDGYTLMMGSSSTLAIGPALGAKLPYDPLRDYTPVSLVANVPILLVIHPALPVRSIPELIKLARARPAEIAYASNGVGTTAHIAAELFAHAAQVKFNHVPYKGGGVAITDLLGGHVQLLFGAVSTSIPHMKAGKLRALGTTSRKRLIALPDVPAISERLPGYEVVQWFGVFAPAGAPAAVVSRLSSEVRNIVALPAVQERFVQQGIEPVSSTPDQFAAYVKAELAKWTKILKQLGIQSENAPS